MSSYATLTDLTVYGLPATALGALSSTVQQAALDDASDIVDSYLRGRYVLPLLAWGTEITQAVCRIAAYNLLSVRGYNPASGADENIRNRYTDSITWLSQVQRQAAHPNVTASQDTQNVQQQPNVTSFSVVSLGNGAVAPNRGW
jgi:phage gp36-like protein